MLHIGGTPVEKWFKEQLDNLTQSIREPVVQKLKNKSAKLQKKKENIMMHQSNKLVILQCKMGSSYNCQALINKTIAKWIRCQN